MKVSVSSLSASCTNPKLSSVLRHSPCGCVGWNAVCHVGWASPCHLLQQVNSAEAQGWWSLKWTGIGATFPGLLLPGEPSVSGSSWCSAFHGIPVFQPHSWFLLTTRELHITHRNLPSTAKAAFKIPASLLFCAVSSLPWNKKHPFVISLFAMKIHPEMAIYNWKKLYPKWDISLCLLVITGGCS